MDLKDKTIAVIGLGYVGLPLAVEFGKKRAVLGFDVRASRIEELARGVDSTLEVDKDELATARHLSFSSKHEDLAIEEAAGRKAIREFRPSQPDDVPDTFAYVRALERAVGYKPATPVKEGVARFVEWYREYYRA